MTIPDDRLRLMFTCCHPTLGVDEQVALMLQTLGGLTTKEIARAFLVPEATMADLLRHAKRKIKVAGIPYRVPSDHELPSRLAAVLTAIYAVFNEGYTATTGAELVRHDLCNEAISLARVIVGFMPDEGEALGLLALLLLQDSRRATRVDEIGALVPLGDQDRSRWNRKQIDEGCTLVQCSLRRGGGPYALQAAIAALHATAPSAVQTDWAEIVVLYSELLRIDPSPVVALNRAAAVAMADGPAPALGLVDALESALGDSHLLHSTRGYLLGELGRFADAAMAYERAIALTTNERERDFLERKLGDVRGSMLA